MRQVSLIVGVLMAVILCSSAEAKDYRASQTPGAPGFFNLREDSGFWTVGYTGEPGQSAREVAEYALKRAADLAAEQHQEWFAVLTTTNRMVQAGVADDLQTRAGNFMGSGAQANTPAPSAGAPRNGSNNTGTFGGDAVPDAVLERWQARRQVRQTILVIELGSGDNASFPGLGHQPQIFPATESSATATSPSPH
ncbi:MAG: hypothetical protein ABUS57_05690 [Pseudomonadota bacterium]